MLEREVAPRWLRSEEITRSGSALKGSAPLRSRRAEAVLCGAGLLLAAALVFGMSRVLASRDDGGRPIPAADRPMALDRPADLEADARRIAERFFAARDWQEVAPLLHDGEAKAASLRARQRRTPKQPVGLRAIKPLQAMPDPALGALYLLDAEDDAFTKRRLYFVDREGPKILWEVFAAECDLPFADFADQTVAGSGQFRVFAAADEYRPVGFDDPDRWRGYRLEHPDCPMPVFALAERGSDPERLLGSALGDGAAEVAVVIELEAIDCPGPLRCAEITRFLGVGWHTGIGTARR